MDGFFFLSVHNCERKHAHACTNTHTSAGCCHVSFLRHTDTQTRRYTDTQTHRHRDTETQRHRDTQTHRHTDTQTHRHADTQTHRHADTQTHRHTDTQTHRRIERSKPGITDRQGSDETADGLLFLYHSHINTHKAVS